MFTFLLFFEMSLGLFQPDTVRQSYVFEQTTCWADEFEVTGLPDSTKWSYEVGGGGWGNHELQFYTDRRTENVQVANGVLSIHAIREPYKGNAYTSARLISRHKGDFKYGRFEVRAKLPPGRGTWPAAWLMPSNPAYGGWPVSGEIDIMEHVGFDPGMVHITMHTQRYNHVKGTQKTATLEVPDATMAFHVYRVDWTPGYIRGFIDNQQIFELLNEQKGFASWPFDQPFHWLLNLAVGGDWGGKMGVDEAAFPASYQIDYVRVYKLKDE